jgi:hypothetical protein
MELRGTLRDFSFEAILGLIRNGHKTGTLRLVVMTPLGMERRVDISFLQGEISSIRCGTFQWLDALREAAICVDGSFEFSVDSALSPQDENAPVSMDVALATIDEAHRALESLTAALPAPNVAFGHGLPSDDTVHISVEEFRLLAVMRDGMTLNDLITGNDASTVTSMRIIRQLMERGLLVASPAG